MLNVSCHSTFREKTEILLLLEKYNSYKKLFPLPIISNSIALVKFHYSYLI